MVMATVSTAVIRTCLKCLKILMSSPASGPMCVDVADLVSAEHAVGAVAHASDVVFGHGVIKPDRVTLLMTNPLPTLIVGGGPCPVPVEPISSLIAHSAGDIGHAGRVTGICEHRNEPVDVCVAGVCLFGATQVGTGNVLILHTVIECSPD